MERGNEFTNNGFLLWIMHLFDMLDTRGANEYSISVFTFHETMVRYPANSDFRHCQASVVRRSLYYLECFEVRFIPIPFPIILYRKSVLKYR